MNEVTIERLNDDRWMYLVRVRACSNAGFRASEGEAKKAAREDEALLRMFCGRTQREAPSGPTSNAR